MAIETKTRTVSDVKTTVERQYGDESGVQLSLPDIIRWINDGQREISETNTSINEKKAVANVVAGQDLYALRSDPSFTGIALINSVRYNNMPMRGITFQEAEKYIVTDSVSQAGIPAMWYEDNNDLRIFPKPEASLTGGLTVYFTTTPVPVTAVGSMLDIPDRYFNALIQYVMAQAYEMDENFQGAQYKSAQFDKSLGQKQNRTNINEGSFPTILIEPEDAW